LKDIFFTSNLHYGSNATNLISCIVYAWKARHMTFQVNSSNESQATDEKLLCSPSIVHMCERRRMLFEENPSKWEQKH